MLRDGSGFVALFMVLFWVLTVFALFWVIRLAVRYGMDDALAKNRHWLVGNRPDPSRDAPYAAGRPRRDAGDPPEPGIWERGDWWSAGQ